ncbi:helix-turn-helix transcriptional regulator [Parasphingorhabdus sp. DH2-15]|uniref:helix-turn-helix transcriptional regulator n=1 Tax=Parasphingorhabdus sp. DH2-15 TaxID=3444112 RepID=UPI003F68755B
MILLDAFIRFTGVGLLVLLAVLTIRDLRKWHGAPYLFLASFTVLATYLGLTIPEFRLPEPVHIFVRIIDIPNLALVWLFSLTLFAQKFTLRWFHIVAVALYSLPISIIRLYQFEIIDLEPEPFLFVAEIFSIALVGHLIFATLYGRGDDLLEKRRRARIYFVIVICFVATVTTFISTDMFLPYKVDYGTLWIISVWPGIVWTCYWLFGAKRDALAFGDQASVKAVQDPVDQKLLAQLEDIMQSDEVFKAADLTIVALAKKMTVTQHRLRELINQRLGHQNFNGYVNSYRIAAVKAAFRDPEKAQLPILTIALDCGFNSLTTFNRAFRESENITPSVYRQQFSEA